MTKTLAVVLLAVILASDFAANAIDDKKLVDLTHEFSAESHHWPRAQPFHFEKVAEGKTAAGFWYSSYNYGGSGHVGTPMDAPFHFAEGKWTAEQIPLGQLIGAGAVIDVSRQADKAADYSLRLSDIRAWEKVHGRIPSGAIVLIRSGWGKYWPSADVTSAPTRPETPTTCIFPVWLKRRRNLWSSSGAPFKDLCHLALRPCAAPVSPVGSPATGTLG